ncbi:Uncharacterised protein [Yersinia enterocolitica]|nr:Uncharacterised protein [Yersinia enterocolitica]
MIPLLAAFLPRNKGGVSVLIKVQYAKATPGGSVLGYLCLWISHTGKNHLGR